MNVRRGLYLAVAAVTVTLFLASPGGTVIVPGQEIAGIRLGMTGAEVRASLGRPARISEWRSALGTRIEGLHYSHVDVDLQHLNGPLA